MSIFLDIFAALLAWGAAAAWVLTGGDKLPADWDHLQTGSTDRVRAAVVGVLEELPFICPVAVVIGSLIMIGITLCKDCPQ